MFVGLPLPSHNVLKPSLPPPPFHLVSNDRQLILLRGSYRRLRRHQPKRGPRKIVPSTAAAAAAPRATYLSQLRRRRGAKRTAGGRGRYCRQC